MSLGLETYKGKVALAKLAKNFFSHIAVGSGTENEFINDDNPPAEQFLNETLYHEIARKKCYRRFFVKPAENGIYEVGNTLYIESAEETNIVLFLAKFTGNEINFNPLNSFSTQIREIALFGEVKYIQSIPEDGIAFHGVYHPENNPAGQVLQNGYIHQIKHIPAYRKVSGDAWDIMFKIDF